MSRSLTIRRLAAATAAVALTAGAALGPAPAHAAASSAPPPPPAASAELSANPYLDELGRPTQHTQDLVGALAAQPWVPEDVSNMLLTAVNFFAGNNGDGGPPLPANAPTFTQFYWPTVSGNCMGEGLNSVGSAIAVPGPADIPAPGAAEGQTSFLFTALGTEAAEGPQHMTVRWFNLSTLTYGETPLADHGINPDGPATVSGVGDTGRGVIVALVDGTIHTAGGNSCSFIPTAALIDAR